MVHIDSVYKITFWICSLCLILHRIAKHAFVILMYRPPSFTINEFDDVIININQFNFSLNLPLPNIMVLGDLIF